MNTCPLSPPPGPGCVGPSPTDPVSKRHHKVPAFRIGEKALYAACKAEGTNTSKEHVTLIPVIGSGRSRPHQVQVNLRNLLYPAPEKPITFIIFSLLATPSDAA